MLGEKFQVGIRVHPVYNTLFFMYFDGKWHFIQMSMKWLLYVVQHPFWKFL